ncbi:MAG: helix-turn-helix transcriptional regulator [Oscillospiraceae bacterium]|nr:helix-turn-helix transcriptional regulator [Oscillospiraceae bacterium]
MYYFVIGGIDISKNINKELLKGSTAILILSLLDKEDLYGYQIIQKLSISSDNIFNLKEGTLYPLLHGLENDGAISAYWVETPEGRSRKYYKLTKNGRNMLDEKQAEWKIFSEAVNKVIGGEKIEYAY